MKKEIIFWGNQADISKCKSRLLFMATELMREGIGINNYFIMHRIRSFAVYGLGDMGEWLINWLYEDSLQPSYGIDQNNELKYSDFRVINPKEDRERVDLIIVTVTRMFVTIANQIKKYNDEMIISIEDIIEEIYFRNLITPVPMRYFKEPVINKNVISGNKKMAICYFAYNRPDKVKITLPAIARCEGVENVPIIIIQDNIKNHRIDEGVTKTKEFIELFQKSNAKLKIDYIQWKRNAGPYISLTQGIAYALEKYERAIRIEDDIEVKTDFLKHMEAAFDYYDNDEKIFSIASYNPSFLGESDSFLSKRACTWGGGFYRKKFFEISWNKGMTLLEGIDTKEFKRVYPNAYDFFEYNKVGILWEDVSEDLMIAYHTVINNLYTVYFNQSLCRNIGFDSGVHGHPDNETNTVNTNYYLDFTQEVSFSDHILKENEEEKLIKGIIGQ